MKDVLTMILAGGKGTRLDPLTRDRAKPAVPFGGLYRIIDFTLSNCINSNLRRIFVVTQYKARSLDRHITNGWSFMSRRARRIRRSAAAPAAHRRAVVQGHRRRHLPEHLLHRKSGAALCPHPRPATISTRWTMSDMIRFHIDSGADLTIGCITAALSDGSHFGIVDADKTGRVNGFVEKPAKPQPMADDPNQCLASMGIYVFTARTMFELLCQDAVRADSDHDFGKNLIPSMLPTQKVFAYRFRDRNRKAMPYWRDVGTLDAYFQANMDLIAVDPVLNLYDREWPIRTWQPQLPPPKFVFNDPNIGEQSRRGEAHDSMVCQGCIVSGGHVRRSILSPNVRVNSYAVVEESILFEGVDVGRHCRIRRTIIDKNVQIPQGTQIGYDLDHDRRRGFHVTEQGIVVLPKADLADLFSSGGRAKD